MKKTGSEQNSPAEPLERARLQADVAKQRVRIAKEELKRARKGLKEAKREARRARKHAAVARKAWKRARRAQKDDSASKENRKPGRRAKRAAAATAAKSPARAPARARRPAATRRAAPPGTERRAVTASPARRARQQAVSGRRAAVRSASRPLRAPRPRQRPGTSRPAGGLDYERVGRSVSERAAQEGGATPESVPTRALKRLRLRRHVRTPPRGFSVSRSEKLAPQQAEAVDMCTALVEAARRWYARSACHDTVVQTNLTRLAVLR